MSVAVGVAVMGWDGRSHAQSPQTLFNQISDYRYFAVRRHNDIQGVEAVFDDYRKNWLRRQNSGVLVGNQSRDARADTPICGDSDFAGHDPDRMKLCGNGHVARAHSTVLYARDSHNGARIRDLGNLSYVGYERLVSNDLFLGVGLSGAVSRIDNKAGTGAQVDLGEFAGHLLGGYRINSNSMVVWNLTAVRSQNDWSRPGNITGKFQTDALFATGAWYTNLQLTQTAYVSLGLDYTLQILRSGSFVESDGALIPASVPARTQAQGDFTASALFVQPLDRAELFARVGVTYVPISPPDRPVDAHLDVGGAMRLSDKVALTGAIGTSYLFSGYAELRGKVRLIGRY